MKNLKISYLENYSGSPLKENLKLANRKSCQSKDKEDALEDKKTLRRRTKGINPQPLVKIRKVDIGVMKKIKSIIGFYKFIIIIS